MSEYITVFHVSPDYNTGSILENGVQPSRSRGKEKASWYVVRERIEWALVHVSDRWKVPVSCIAVFEVHAPVETLARTGHYGVYKARQSLKALRASPAHHFIEE